MFISKNTIRRLEDIVNALKLSVKNKEVLDYILTNLASIPNKGGFVKIQENKILIVDNSNNKSFYLELSPSIDKINKVYTRLTLSAGDFDERMTATFNENSTDIRKYSSSIIKDKNDSRIESIADEFGDIIYINDELYYVKRFKTNTLYPAINNAYASSYLLEFSIKKNGKAAYKEVELDSSGTDSRRFGLFDAKSNELTPTTNPFYLKDVEDVSEEEYNSFLKKDEPNIVKELKNRVIK